MMKQVVLTFAFALTVSGCVATPTAPILPPPPATVPHLLSSDEKDAVKRGLLKNLKDPNSAIFGSMAASQSSKSVIYVCGVVNAKNSYGGYTGDQMFMGILGVLPFNKGPYYDFSIISMGGDPAKAYTTTELCRRYNVIGL